MTLENRVAEALWAVEPTYDGSPLEGLPQVDQDAFTRSARAAIEAMNIPSRVWVQVGQHPERPQ